MSVMALIVVPKREDNMPAPPEEIGEYERVFGIISRQANVNEYQDG